MFADLHLHSSASDGLLSPTEIVKIALEQDIQIIALTDHDTTDGIEEAVVASQFCSVRVVPGIELSTELNDQEIHVLGYKISYTDVRLERTLTKLKQARIQRIKDITSRLNSIGFEISWQDVVAVAGDTSSIGRPHIARVMVEKAYASSVKEVFTQWIGPDCPAFVKRYKLTPVEAIELVKSVGGYAFLAHPGLLRQGTAMAKSLIAQGLDGIEVFHSEHSAEQTRKFLEFAQAENLFICGGSDCHGVAGEMKMGSVLVPAEFVEPWLKD